MAGKDGADHVTRSAGEKAASRYVVGQPDRPPDVSGLAEPDAEDLAGEPHEHAGLDAAGTDAAEDGY